MQWQVCILPCWSTFSFAVISCYKVSSRYSSEISVQHHIHRCLQSCVGTQARLGYVAFDVQLRKAYSATAVLVSCYLQYTTLLYCIVQINMYNYLYTILLPCQVVIIGIIEMAVSKQTLFYNMNKRRDRVL